MHLTRWDARVLARAAVIAALALAIAWLLTAATDEGGVSWSERAGRTLPLTPACAAVGAWAALAPVRARGEALALEALGRSRAQVAAAAVGGAALVAVLAAAAIGAGRAVDVAGFFPSATHPTAWRWQDGAFVDRVDGLSVSIDGVPSRGPTQPGASLEGTPPMGRAAAALATAAAGLALPLLIAHQLLARAAPGRPRGAERRLLREDAVALGASGAAIAASIVLFQMAAAHLAPALLASGPPAALLAFAAWRYRGS
jgi:hypothetical protein